MYKSNAEKKIHGTTTQNETLSWKNTKHELILR